MKNKTYNNGPKSIVWFMLFVFCQGLFGPSVLFAGGPSQPEVQSFTPIGVSEMVDPFTGDFNYNIPLMDIDGYPVNIGYSSGVTMDQEASWVGLGWNLNLGSITRTMRGLPDDFDGDLVVKKENRKEKKDLSVSFNLPQEIFGYGNLELDLAGGSASLNVGMTISHSNYSGLGVGFNFGPSFKFANDNSTAFGGSLNLSGSSENGAGISTNLSLSRKLTTENELQKRPGYSIGLGGGFNSRSGLQSLSFEASYLRATKASNALSKFSSKLAGKGINTNFDFGLQTYSPSSGPSMTSEGVSGNISTTLSFFGIDQQVSIGFTSNKQYIAFGQNTKSSPAFGFFNLQNGEHNDNALLDFNRDNVGAFTKYTPNLSSSFLTADIFTINGQGVGGSFKGSRNEVGFVFDPITVSNSFNQSFGLELGAGNILDLGADVQYNTTSSVNKRWVGNENKAKNELKFENSNGLIEAFVIKDANEMSVDSDPFITNHFNLNTLQKINLEGNAIFPRLEKKINGSTILTNNRIERQKRNALLSYITIKDLKDQLGLNEIHPSTFIGAKDHHIGEITQLGTDGRRYVFGIPAYNHVNRSITFATGDNLEGDNGVFPTNYYQGIMSLGSEFSSIVSLNNSKGIDNSYSEELMPGYAHSFLLTAVLSDDYVDSDIEKGPSINDQGNYVKFDYTKLQGVKWRNPIGANEVFYGQGTKTDLTDDKSSVTYGEKDIWYVNIVETKNYIAVFELEDREDSKSVNGIQGGLSNIPSGKLLRSITLYTKPDYEANSSNLSAATPIQKVNFVYDYSLCQGFPGNINNNGKLTLKEIYFTYQGSMKLKRSSYKFDYSNNMSYNLKGSDRWGSYKPSSSGNAFDLNASLTNADFPYTIQDEVLTNEYVQAWTLNSIKLPSGGRILIDYESDDYAYVQHKRASEMMPICAVSDENENMLPGGLNGEFAVAAVAGHNNVKDSETRSIYVKMKPGFNNVSDYLDVNEPIYFRALTEMFPLAFLEQNRFEYIGSYAKVLAANKIELNSEFYLKIDLKPENLEDDGEEKYSPISKAGILFGRMNLPRTFNGLMNISPSSSSQSGIVAFANDCANAFESFKELFKGPNVPLYDSQKCHKIVLNKSFVRLKEPTKHKLGGGLRVRQITIQDNWNEMVTNNDPAIDYSYSYGQKFEYTLEDGTSSGVASYEPMIGGDENPLHKPYFYDEKIKLAPDNNLYLEEPIMESQFPNPTVGYSRVIISDLPRANVNRTATGKIVKEFYTAKDFPTFVSRTDLTPLMANSFLPRLPKYSFLTASQGFKIEINDMHGKPKSETVYPENSNVPNSQVKYSYLSEPITYEGFLCNKLKNSVTVIEKDGSSQTRAIGERIETVADFTENNTNSIGGSVDLNVNSLFAGIVIVAPTIWPSVDKTTSNFRYATLNKTVERFGILGTTTAIQDGSTVETNNLAYDSETGDVLLTQTTTNFNDKIYSLNYPSHWAYDQMGAAYKNNGYKISGYPMGVDGFVPIPTGVNHFTEGDEVKVTSPSFSGPKKGWVLQITAGGIRVIDEEGNPINGTDCTLTIMRSGRRNKQTTSIASLTSLSNPLNGLLSGVFTSVLNAGAVEFSNNWRTYCDCFDEVSSTSPSTNPYISNNLGVWRPKKSHTYLTDRAQTNYLGNTNIRKDGVFMSYSPFYQYNQGKWQIFRSGWTFVSEVTEFSPNGQTVETRDALGRYSTSLHGFNNTLTTSVAANTKINQLIEGNFEDAAFTNCMDQGFFKNVPSIYISNVESHTGNNSIHISGGTTLNVVAEQVACLANNNCINELTALGSNLYQVSGCTNNCDLTYTIISGQGNANLGINGLLTITNTSTNGQYFELNGTVFTKSCILQIKVTSLPPSNSNLNVEIISQTPR